MHDADFKVVELLDQDFRDEGEHLYLQIEKTGLTSVEVARFLAEHYSVAQSDVSYSGMKDKRAVATQWFSVRLPKTENQPVMKNIRVLQSRRDRRKLRRGKHQANRFEIVIRGIEGAVPINFDSVFAAPFPNYFGPQRFGFNGGNWERAVRWLKASRPRVSRFSRSLHLSTLRASIFNDVLAMRVDNGTWATPVDGDCLENGVPTGPMWGRGTLPTSSRAREIENNVHALQPCICDALEWVGLNHDRRPLSIEPTDVEVHTQSDKLSVAFTLPPSAYANVALHEHFDLVECR